MHDLITILIATQSIVSIIFELTLGALSIYIAMLRIRKARRRNDEGTADPDRSRRPGSS